MWFAVHASCNSNFFRVPQIILYQFIDCCDSKFYKAVLFNAYVYTIDTIVYNFQAAFFNTVFGKVLKNTVSNETSFFVNPTSLL